MRISMSEINKKANLIINEVAETGEVVVILKHGKPIAEIRPIPAQDSRKGALSYLSGIKPAKVTKSLDIVIGAGRQRGL